LETRWLGIVNRTNFEQVTTNKVGTFRDWYATYQHPRPPIVYNTAIDHDTVSTQYTYPFLANASAGDLALTGDNSPIVSVGYKSDEDNVDGEWDATIDFHITALYDEAKQESVPCYLGQSVVMAAGKELGVWIGVEYSDDATTYRINKRVTGARVYYEDIINEPGILYQLIEIDFAKGCQRADADTFEGWNTEVANEACSCPYTGGDTGSIATQRTKTLGEAFIFPNPLLGFTYEINTGYPASVNTHARYKTAVISNRRLFAGNIYQSGKAKGDMMIGSPENRFDILPEIEPYARSVTVGDGDEIIKLEAYADRILQFKKRILYIVNVGGGVGEEFIESQHNNMGVANPSQTCMTEFGVAWVNAAGVFLYDGQTINDLTKDRLIMSDSTRPRALNVTETNIPLIGYLTDKKWLIVHPQSKITDGNDVEAWIHDFKNDTWTYSAEFTTTDYYKTNMVATPDNNLIFATGTNSSFNPTILKYRAPAANVSTGKLLFLTKDFNLQSPGIKKKLKSVYITYSAAANTRIEADILYTHPTGSTDNAMAEADGGTTYYTEAAGFISTSGNIRTVELVPSTFVTNAYTFQLKLHNPNAAYPFGADFKLYDIQFVYRPLRVR